MGFLFSIAKGIDRTFETETKAFLKQKSSGELVVRHRGYCWQHLKGVTANAAYDLKKIFDSSFIQTIGIGLSEENFYSDVKNYYRRIVTAESSFSIHLALGMLNSPSFVGNPHGRVALQALFTQWSISSVYETKASFERLDQIWNLLPGYYDAINPLEEADFWRIFIRAEKKDKLFSEICSADFQVKADWFALVANSKVYPENSLRKPFVERIKLLFEMKKLGKLEAFSINRQGRFADSLYERTAYLLEGVKWADMALLYKGIKLLGKLDLFLGKLDLSEFVPFLPSESLEERVKIVRLIQEIRESRIFSISDSDKKEYYMRLISLLALDCSAWYRLTEHASFGRLLFSYTCRKNGLENLSEGSSYHKMFIASKEISSIEQALIYLPLLSLAPNSNWKELALQAAKIPLNLRVCWFEVLIREGKFVLENIDALMTKVMSLGFVKYYMQHASEANRDVKLTLDANDQYVIDLIKFTAIITEWTPEYIDSLLERIENYKNKYQFFDVEKQLACLYFFSIFKNIFPDLTQEETEEILLTFEIFYEIYEQDKKDDHLTLEFNMFPIEYHLSKLVTPLKKHKGFIPRLLKNAMENRWTIDKCLEFISQLNSQAELLHNTVELFSLVEEEDEVILPREIINLIGTYVLQLKKYT